MKYSIGYKKKRILFIDFDGTLVETASGQTFPKDVADVKVKHEVIEALKTLTAKTDLQFIAIVSNQGGVEQGHYTMEAVKCKVMSITRIVQAAINDNLAKLNKPGIAMPVCFCASTDKENPDRKPNIGMIERILADIERRRPDVDTDNACQFMIGDASGKPGDFSDSDKKCAENAEIDYIDVRDFVEDMKTFC
jgi:DNA 3'-phosphatase